MRTTVHIENLKCSGCERTIINKLSQQNNIADVEVNQDEQTVSFDFHSKDDFESAKRILATIGYPIVGEDNTLNTKVKSYISCAIGRFNK